MPDDGRLILGTERFRIRDKLGAGGMGVVYRVWDQVLHEEVALKTLSNLGPSAIYRFKKEFRRLSDLSHPNLVRLKELHATGVTWFFTMDLVEGHDLDFRRISSRTLPEWTEPLTWNTTETMEARGAYDGDPTEPLDGGSAPWDPAREPELRRLFRSIGETLMALHEVGIVHRDLKPSNIRVDAQRLRVVLLDFGLATNLDEESLAASTTGLLAGTIPYLAPEQTTGDKVTPAADWYAFGTVLYEALTGRLPFSGPVFQQLLDKQTQRPVGVRQWNQAAPKDLADLAMGLLKPNPAERPSSDEVRTCLELNPIPVRWLIAEDKLPVPPKTEGLRRALSQPSDRLRIVVLSSEDGRLQYCLQALRESGGLVLTGRCRLRESVPFQGVDDQMDHLGRKMRGSWRHPAGHEPSWAVGCLARTFPSLRRIPWMNRAAERADEDRSIETLAAGWTELLQKMSEGGPVVLCLEALDAVDQDSLSLLCATVDALPPHRTWLFATSKSPEAARWLTRRLPHAELWQED